METQLLPNILRFMVVHAVDLLLHSNCRIMESLSVLNFEHVIAEGECNVFIKTKSCLMHFRERF